MVPTDLQDKNEDNNNIALTLPNHLRYAQTALRDFACNASSPITCNLYITKHNTYIENCTKHLRTNKL